jgi:hypothetical protein
MDPKEFITKDSGHRVTFDSGMVRDTSAGKTLWHLVTAGPLLRRWASLLTRGAQKYSPNNWMKASGQAELDRFRESAFRHFMQWYNGETDEDHAAAVFFNINGAEYVKEKRPNYDGLYCSKHFRTRWKVEGTDVYVDLDGGNEWQPSTLASFTVKAAIDSGEWVKVSE